MQAGVVRRGASSVQLVGTFRTSSTSQTSRPLCSSFRTILMTSTSNGSGSVYNVVFALIVCLHTNAALIMLLIV